MKSQFALVILAFTVAAPPVASPFVSTPVSAQDTQDTQQEWLDQCRRENTRRNGTPREKICEVRTESFRAGSGALHIEPGHNGGVSVEASVGTEVDVEARIRAEAPDIGRATAIARGITATHSGNRIAATGPATEDNESWSVMYVIHVPRASDLEIEAQNGPVSVRNVRGHIVASTVNGPLSLTDVAGDVQARTKNGPLEVRLSGTRWEGAGLDAQTSNGPVVLTMPEQYNADLETGTTNGPFDSDIPLNVRFNGDRTRHINTKIGDGGAPVKVVTTNGPISIRKR